MPLLENLKWTDANLRIFDSSHHCAVTTRNFLWKWGMDDIDYKKKGGGVEWVNTLVFANRVHSSVVGSGAVLQDGRWWVHILMM
jgi:hypothetical protein